MKNILKEKDRHRERSFTIQEHLISIKKESNQFTSYFMDTLYIFIDRLIVLNTKSNVNDDTHLNNLNKKTTHTYTKRSTTRAIHYHSKVFSFPPFFFFFVNKVTSFVKMRGGVGGFIY